MSSFPHWLELSGLPQLLCAETRGSAAWLILRTIIDLDCAANSNPGTVEISMEQLAIRTGLDAAATCKTIKQLNKRKWLVMWLPDNDEEVALIKVAAPIRTPSSHADVIASHPLLASHRYCDCPQAEDSAPLPAVQETVDLYLNTCGFKINQFIIDRLTILTARTTSEQRKRTFYRAQKAGVRDLATIERWCSSARSSAGVPPAADGLRESSDLSLYSERQS